MLEAVTSRLWAWFSAGTTRARFEELMLDFERSTFRIFAYLGRYCGQQMHFVGDMSRREAGLLVRATSTLIGDERGPAEGDAAGGRR